MKEARNRVIRQGAGKEHPHPEGKKTLMSSRLAITALIATVALLTVGAGAGFAQGGLDSSSSAGVQQYGEKPKSERLGVIGEIETETPAQDSAPQSTPAPAAAPAPAPQAESGQLPFTGFAAGAMLLIGALLLTGGLLLRRTTRRSDAA